MKLPIRNAEYYKEVRRVKSSLTNILISLTPNKALYILIILRKVEL